MAIYQRKQTNILLAFKVLQFVKQLRRRVQPRILHGATSVCHLGTDVLGLRAIKRSCDRGPRVRNTRSLHHGQKHVCKRRKRRVGSLGSRPNLQGPALHNSAASDTCAEKVQHMLSSIDRVSRAGCALSIAAGDDRKFLKHINAPILEGCSWNQTIQLLVTVREALAIFSTCRLQHSVDWLVAQGLAFGLDIDDTFVANYEHLLLRLQADLIEALARKAVEELLRGGHDKRQRKLLSLLFSEFGEKPRPLSTSFPWTIKPSLAVLWGVCWMFYDRDGSDDAVLGRGDTRVPRNRLLQHLDLRSVQWNAPASSDYVNLGLELIGAPPQHPAQQPSPSQAGIDNSVGLDAASQARNAETWASDLQGVDFRLPSDEHVHAGAHSASMRFDAAPPQLPAQSTYYSQHHDHFEPFVAGAHDSSFLPHNPGSPLTAFAHLGTDSNLNDPWHHQLPYTCLPHAGRRHHQSPTSQTPSIRVTGTAGSDLAPPQQDFAAFGGIYHQPQASPLQLNTNFNYNHLSYAMGSQLSPDASSIQIPHIPIKHERTSSIASNSNIPTPVSMSGPRSPLLSPTTAQRSNADASPRNHSRRISEDLTSQDGDDDGSLRGKLNHKRAEEPPRNQQGKMICINSECAGLLFDRKCEWSKHMDKHDRPYKCNVAGCEKLQGFTYSGGLLRHEREVHKMHGGTKKSLFCPFHDCKRSSGAGFTRKENLAEHIRRVHRRTSMSADMHGLIIRRETLEASPIAETRHTSESPYSRALEYRDDEESAMLKRKRGSDSGFSDRDNEDLRAEVKRLRQENEEKDSRLRQLEQAVMALQRR
ncbi:hypothetical protein DE146DRAFT_759903 [Phaeosphaeria sp. MPI-PUGE-AT-0046c]|nr:hypothetical protein DE146DRAFT_759903 [Phaeosphaeria sp. MPI-PUGE-AT-0046c]